MGKLKQILCIVGVALCLYPTIKPMITRNKEQEIISEYRNNVSDSEMLGIIEIPVVDVLLPIYSGTTEDVLKIGIGHLDGSNFPGGGKNTHCLLAGHRGLPNAELFARLGEIKEGDCFFIETHNDRLIYQVCEIRVVKPEETEGIEIQKDRDLVSLITCTPYGINTHRLIVTGERMEEKNDI